MKWAMIGIINMMMINEDDNDNDLNDNDNDDNEDEMTQIIRIGMKKMFGLLSI